MSDMHSMVGPFVTDALDADERDDFESHLETCADCCDEVRDLQETLSELAALHEMAPPPGLRASILDAISTTDMLPADSTDAAPPTPLRAQADASNMGSDQESTPEEPSNIVTPAFGQRRRPVLTWLAAAAAVLAVALGGVTVWQQSELQSVQAADAQRTEFLASPDLQVRSANLDGADLTYLVSQVRGEAIVASSNFPDPGANRSWQVWVMQDDVPRSGAVLDEGGVIQVIIEDVGGGEALAITNEPRGGSPGPTGQVQADVTLEKT